MNTTGQLLASIARRKRWSESRIARELGVSRQAIGEMRTGQQRLSEDHAGRVAGWLKLDPLYVLACIRTERAKHKGVKSMWERIARGATAVSESGPGCRPTDRKTSLSGGRTMAERELMRFDLSGKRALVTGGASGIGLGAVTLLARSGAKVAINDLDSSPHLEPALAGLKAEGLDVFAAPGNVGEPDSVKAIVAAATTEMGGLDYLVNNAGTPATSSTIPPSDLDAMTEAFWETILQVNLMSAFRMTHAAAPHLKASRGSVVNTVSMSAYGGGGSSLAYSTAKAGLLGLIKELARGLAPEVRVNGIAPGMVNSNWQRSFGDLESAAREHVPLQRIGQPEDYAQAIVFLTASASS